LAAWKDYLRFHLLAREADVLPRRFAGHAQAFRASAAERSQRAIEVTSRMLPEEVGRLYVARYFPPEQKARVQAILDRVSQASIRHIAKSKWMSRSARKVAVAKLDAMYFGIGGPEEWP